MFSKEALAAVKDISPPAIVASAPILGLTLQDWALWLAIAYSIIRLLALIPKLLGCARCFYKNKGCELTCKNPVI